MASARKAVFGFFSETTMKLSVIIPAYNEFSTIAETLIDIHVQLCEENIIFEIIVVNDNSNDGTPDLVDKLSLHYKNIRRVDNIATNGFGLAIRCGLKAAQGEYVIIVMADASDDPNDIVQFYRMAEREGLDAVFGSRFMKGGFVIDYPLLKLCLNRITNWLIALLFVVSYTDTTNAFKLYRRETIEGLKPFLSHHFNLTVELPLKVIVRGYSYRVLPNTWRNRKSGESKLKIKEMGSRYWFIIFYCLIEKWLSVGDYKK